ncbi:hypothetical protein [Tateyamaria sp. SN6-1]|uniref:hypothetical protein n=1 Tax=Tateyamaria sp. SN6-1 TaxID=3092148 RepID=UPI0039F4E0C4
MAETSAKSAVEAELALADTGDSADLSEADARRMAEAAQAKQRFELLLETVRAPVEAPSVAAPTAAQAEAGPTETEGTPV